MKRNIGNATKAKLLQQQKLEALQEQKQKQYEKIKETERLIKQVLKVLPSEVTIPCREFIETKILEPEKHNKIVNNVIEKENESLTNTIKDIDYTIIENHLHFKDSNLNKIPINMNLTKEFKGGATYNLGNNIKIESNNEVFK